MQRDKTATEQSKVELSSVLVIMMCDFSHVAIPDGIKNEIQLKVPLPYVHDVCKYDKCGLDQGATF